MKITQNQLKKMISETVAKKLATLKEADEKDNGMAVPDAKDIVAFTKKFDDHFTDIIVKTKALADEGEALLRTNLTNHPEVGTRNELVIQRVGLLRSMANSLSTTWERVRRYMP